MTDLVRTVSLDDLANVLQLKGFRAQPAEWPGGREALLSAAGGVTFNIVTGNGSPGAYGDFTFFAGFRLEGLPIADICAKWNMERRFARAHGRDGMLNLEMDVLLGTGVGRDYVAAMTDVWNQLLNELLITLRAEAAKTGSEA